MNKVLIGRQQGQFVPDAKLCQESVNGANLHTGATTAIAQICGVNVILSLGRE